MSFPLLFSAGCQPFQTIAPSGLLLLSYLSIPKVFWPGALPNFLQFHSVNRQQGVGKSQGKASLLLIYAFSLYEKINLLNLN